MKTLRAHFDGRVLVPDGPVDLPTGSPLHIYIVSIGTAPSDHEPTPGSPAALLEGLRDDPHISAEAAEDLERAIAEGKMRVRDAGIFEE